MNADTGLRVSGPDAAGSELPVSVIMKEHVRSVNSIRLHRCYMNNLTCFNEEAASLIQIVFTRDFGSFGEWAGQFRLLGMDARGWVITGFDLIEGKVCNFIADSYGEGVWGVLPLLAMGVLEHEHCADFQTRREYVESFLDSIDWIVVEKRLGAAIRAYEDCKGIF